jgi:hypothetical protein
LSVGFGTSKMNENVLLCIEWVKGKVEALLVLEWVGVVSQVKIGKKVFFLWMLSTQAYAPGLVFGVDKILMVGMTNVVWIFEFVA